MTESAQHSQPDNLRRLQPLRILLSGQDRRFVRVTAFLLAQRGYQVAEAGVGELLRAAERDSPDVVLVEAGGSRAAAARQVAQLVALAAAPAVVVATDERERLWPRLRSIEKWAPIDELIRVIEKASLERQVPVTPADSAHDHI